MNKSLDLIDRFFSIITESENRQNDRLKSEWEYLLTLLKTDPISYDRIEAYLNILQQQNSQTKKITTKNRKSEDSEYGNDLQLLLKNAEFLSKLLSENNEKINYLEKIANC